MRHKYETQIKRRTIIKKLCLMAAGRGEPVISSLADCATQVDLLALSNEPSRSNCHTDRVSVMLCNKQCRRSFIQPHT